MKNPQIVVLTGAIKVAATTIRDIFPDDLPYLWERIEPFIETIEGCSGEIRSIAKDGGSDE